MLQKFRAVIFLVFFIGVSVHSDTPALSAITTKYPIVLAHGVLGFDSMLGAVRYWNGIPEALRERGISVYVTRVSKLNSTQVRGEQLSAQIEAILKQTGAQKVNIIGHSHGGLDARYVAATHPEWVASVSTIASPHLGALLADKLLGSQSILNSATMGMLNAFGKLMNLLSGDGHEQDAKASLASLTTNSLKNFNESYPDGLPSQPCGEGPAVVNGIRFYSWGGVKVRTNFLDFTDYLFSLTALADDRDTDGLVERCSTHLGKVIRDNYQHNHLDLVNGMWGFVSKSDTNPVQLFLQHAKRLQEDGV